MAFADSATLIDNFNRADGALGASWPGKIDSSHDTMVVNGNRLRGNISGFVCSAYYTTTYGPNVEVYATVSTWNADGVTLYARMNNPNSGSASGYLVNISGGSVLATFFKFTSSTVYTQIGSATSLTVASGDKLGFSVEDSGANVVLRVFQNTGGGWTQIATVTDTSSPLAGTGYVGFDTWQNNVYLDDAYAGTISAAATSTVILPATRRGGFPALITM